MVEINNKTISYFFVGVVLVLGIGYVMNSNGGKIETGRHIWETCSDSDNGLTYEVRGTTTSSNGTSLTDFCPTWRGGLTEYSCDAVNNVVGRDYYCSSGCSNGACFSDTPTTCMDSDGGVNYNTQGRTVADFANGSHVEYNDYCCEQNGVDLCEYYCTLPMRVHYACPNGCSNGACVPSTATTTLPTLP